MEAPLQSGHVRLCTLPSFGGHLGFTHKIFLVEHDIILKIPHFSCATNGVNFLDFVTSYLSILNFSPLLCHERSLKFCIFLRHCEEMQRCGNFPTFQSHCEGVSPWQSQESIYNKVCCRTGLWIATRLCLTAALAMTIRMDCFPLSLTSPSLGGGGVCGKGFPFPRRKGVGDGEVFCRLRLPRHFAPRNDDKDGLFPPLPYLPLRGGRRFKERAPSSERDA